VFGQNDIRLLVERAYMDAGLLTELTSGLQSHDPGLAGDCAELLCQMSEQADTLLCGYESELRAAEMHPSSRVREAVIATLAHMCSVSPDG